MACFKVSHHLPGGAEENHVKFPVGTIEVSPEIRLFTPLEYNPKSLPPENSL